jgi:hypothetical protein
MNIAAERAEWREKRGVGLSLFRAELVDASAAPGRKKYLFQGLVSATSGAGALEAGGDSPKTSPQMGAHSIQQLAALILF